MELQEYLKSYAVASKSYLKISYLDIIDGIAEIGVEPIPGVFHTELAEVARCPVQAVRIRLAFLFNKHPTVA